MITSLHFAGQDWHVQSSEISSNLLADLIACGKPGSADEAVEHVCSTYSVTGDHAACRGFLQGYGAWSDDELSHHDDNLQRLVWLVGCALAEEEEAYLSAY